MAKQLNQRVVLDPVKRGRDGRGLGRGLSSALLKFHEAEKGAGVRKGKERLQPVVCSLSFPLS